MVKGMMDERLWQAYCEMDYYVHSLQLTILVGQRHAELDKYLASWGARSFAFLTAWNPRSQPLPDDANRQRNLQLEQQLHAAGYRYLAGAGISRSQAWPPEESFLVIDIPRTTSLELAASFEQNAIVYGLLGQPSELLAVTEC